MGAAGAPRSASRRSRRCAPIARLSRAFPFRSINDIVCGYPELNNGAAMFVWDDLRFFLAVARTGTSIGAAAELGTSQPTVVRRICALEAATG